jgi:hypothetical protein
MKNQDPTKPKKPVYQFNLTNLETEAFHALEAWNKLDNPESRTLLFTTIRDLTYAILCVGEYSSKYSINPDEIAYEYALYLFERLVLGTFKPTYNDRFPFQKYISINLKHVIITKNKDKNWHELIVDLEYLLNLENNGMMDFGGSEENNDSRIDKQALAKKLHKSLRIYYTRDEINRLLPMTIGLLDLESKQFYSENFPTDLKDFMVVLVCISKRIITTHNVNMLPHDMMVKEFKKVVSSSVRSTVFLSAVVNSEFFPKELLLSLDIDSLYRLVAVSGGQNFRVPTKKELDALIGSVVTVSKVIMEGKTIDQSLGETKKDLELMFPTRIRGTNIEAYISKILEVHSIFGEDPNSDPMVINLITAIKSIDKMMEHIVKNAKNESPETILQYYKEISTTFKILTDGLVKISTMAIASKTEEKENASGKDNPTPT